MVPVMSDEATGDAAGSSATLTDEAESWALSLLTSAHYELPEYGELLKAVPPGGLACLVAISLAAMEEYGVTKGLSPDETLAAFALELRTP